MKELISRLFSWGGIARGEGGFVEAAMFAAPYVLNALGGIFGRKKKYVDPEALRQKYGPRAIARDTQELSNYILNSPYGQQLLAQAAEAGQGLQTEMASRAAAAGVDPSSGGQSGAGDFATSAASQAQSGLERQTKANVWQQAMPIAAGLNQNLQNLELANTAERNTETTPFQRIAAAAGQFASIPNATKTRVRKPGEEGR